MAMNIQLVKHSDQITDYDRQALALYLHVFDARKAGIPWSKIAKDIWADSKPESYRQILKSHLSRFRWFSTTGYLLLLAEDPTPRTDALDQLVASGRMSADERAFLDSPAGQKYWPVAKH